MGEVAFMNQFHLDYLVIPFEHSNVTLVFQQLMNDIFKHFFFQIQNCSNNYKMTLINFYGMFLIPYWCSSMTDLAT
jgi:hypothetical protein